MDEDIDQLRQRIEQANLFACIRNAEGDAQFYQEMREALARIGALMREELQPRAPDAGTGKRYGNSRN